MTKLERLRAIQPLPSDWDERDAHEDQAFVFAALPELLAVVDAYRTRDEARSQVRHVHASSELEKALAKLEADDG